MPKSDLPFDPGEYALVAERITRFYERYPQGRIVTELIERTEREVTFRALVYRAADEREPAATGWASEREGNGDINLVACLENTETSAVGRALANLGFTASRHRPSWEEMRKAERTRVRALAERDPTRGAALQARADAVTDVLGLIAIAERSGMPPSRAELMRARLLARDVPLATIEHAERVLRRWISTRTTERLVGDDPVQRRGA